MLEPEACVIDVVNASRKWLVIDKEENFERIDELTDLQLSDSYPTPCSSSRLRLTPIKHGIL